MGDPQAAYAQLRSGATDWHPDDMFARICGLSSMERGSILAAMWRDMALGWRPPNHVIETAIKELECGREGIPLEVRFTGADVALVLQSYLASVEHIANPRRNLREISEARIVLKLLFGSIDWLFEWAGLVRPFLPLIERVSNYAALLSCLAIGDELQADTHRLKILQNAPGQLLDQELEIVIRQQTYHVLASALAEMDAARIGHQDWLRFELAHALSGIKEWRQFAESSVSQTLCEAHRVAAGTSPYRSDKLLPLNDVPTVVRSIEFGLRERLPWALEGYGKLLEGAALAPDREVKSVPSQSLSVALGHAAVRTAQPEAVLALRATVRKIRHEGIKKKLSRALKQSETALAAHPERILDLCGEAELDPSLAKLLSKSLEGLLAVEWWFDAGVWLNLLNAKLVAKNASGLVWEVTDGEEVFTAMPEVKKEVQWRRRTGELLPFRTSQRIRLWHPTEASEKERADWQTLLASSRIVQPFPQAFRETYALRADEAASKRTSMFAGIQVEAMPLIGLSRTLGWHGASGRLSRTVARRRFSFYPGTSVYPGSTGLGTTGEFSIDGPEQSFAAVPSRILSEVLRTIDLIVAAGAAGTKDHLHEFDGPIGDGYVGTRSIEMRKTLIAICHPGAVFEKRWLTLADNYRVHLGTGLVFNKSSITQIPVTAPDEPSLMGNDRIMRLVFQAIKQFGLGS